MSTTQLTGLDCATIVNGTQYCVAITSPHPDDPDAPATNTDRCPIGENFLRVIDGNEIEFEVPGWTTDIDAAVEAAEKLNETRDENDDMRNYYVVIERNPDRDPDDAECE